MLMAAWHVGKKWGVIMGQLVLAILLKIIFCSYNCLNFFLSVFVCCE